MSEYKLTTVCYAAVLALVLAACSSSSSDNDSAAAPDPTPTQPTEPEPAEPTDLENAQAAAAAAAAAAKTASDSAAMAASDAGDATANLATSQTGEMAGAQAMKAQEQADAAMTAYMAAKAASDAAAAATDATAAIKAQLDAESAQADAEAAAMKAGEYSEMAEASAMGELMIDGTMKSVGDSSVDAMGGPSSVTTGSGDAAKTVVTGLIKSLNPKADGAIIPGVAFTPPTVDDLNTAVDETQADGATKGTAYKQAAAARPGLEIGKTLDSSDDKARLMLITHYAGEQMVRIAKAGTDQVTGTKAGYLTINDNDDTTTDTHNTPLKSIGMFYLATGTDGNLVNTDSVPAPNKATGEGLPVELFTYTIPTGATGAGEVRYARLTSSNANANTGVTTYTYTTGFDITAPNRADGPDAGTEPDQSPVTSGIPAPVAYQHIHFGVWAGLGEAAKDGSQSIADLGIGFVQSIGDGMTGADMPNDGKATYNGNWAATVRVANVAGGGSLSLTSGDATLTADFAKSTIMADLDGLADLEGTISGNTFSGTKATVEAGNTHGLTPSGTFTGSFSGGFYGAKGAEAGGIFDFTSTGMTAGEFRGAFGGKKAEPAS